MNEQYILTDFVIGSHLRRFHALQYLHEHGGGFGHDIAKAVWRGSGDEQDSLEELERKIGFFLTDLEERGLIKTEMRVMEDDFQIFNFSISGAESSYEAEPRIKRAGRYYMITERGMMLFTLMFAYVVYAKLVTENEECAKGN